MLCVFHIGEEDEKTYLPNPRTIGFNQRDLPQGHQG